MDRGLETDAAYARVFLDIGIDIDGLPGEEAGRRIATHLTWKRLAEALDEWALLRHDIAWGLKRTSGETWPPKRHLFQVARAVDRDELRSQARLVGEEFDRVVAARLAESPEIGRLPSAALRHLAMIVFYSGSQSRRDSAVRLRLNALILRPGDVRLNSACAGDYAKMEPPQWSEAVHYWSIAVALRPENHALRSRLAYALEKQGRWDDATTQYREAIRLSKTRF